MTKGDTKGRKVLGDVWAFIRRHQNAVVFCLFCILVAVATYPFIKSPSTVLVSPINGDSGYSTVLFEAIKRERLNPFVDGTAVSVAYPDGIENNTGVMRVSFFSTLSLWIGTLLFGGIFIHSMVAIIGTILSGFLAYLFVRRVTKSTLPAVLAGVALLFMPTMLAILFSASPYTHMWIYIATMWLFWSMATSGVTIRKFSLSFGLIFLMLFWTPYYTYHVLMIAAVGAVVVAVTLLRAFGWKRALLFLIASGVTLLTFSALYYLVGTTVQHSQIPARTIDEIYQQSAHPLMYILPGVFSLFAQPLYELLVHFVPRAGFTSLYLGITVLIVAVFALTILKRKPKQNSELKMAVIIALSVFGVMFAFSLAPTISAFGIDIPTPSYLIAEFVPSLRAGQRLVMPMIAALIILFGIGLYVIQKKLPVKYRIVALLAITAIVLIDVASMPPARFTVVEKRDIFASLARQEQGLTATYLHRSLVSNPGQYICYAQFQHEMPIVNDCAIQRDPYNFDKPKKTLAAIILQPICQQIDALKDMKTKYLIVGKDDNREVYDCLSARSDIDQILSDDAYDVYTIARSNN